MTALPWLDADDTTFPDPESALAEPQGLLAAGGDLSPRRLLSAYGNGIFPWYEEGQPILWWCPDPRAVLLPEEIRVSRSLRKCIRRDVFTVSLDEAFDAVTAACAEPRPSQGGTWITAAMRDAYAELHRLGYAHSVETWQDGELVGGLYGVAIGSVFFGESMFSRVTDASKVALVHLAEKLQSWGYELIDCQIESAHLASLGSRLLPRPRFVAMVRDLCRQEPTSPGWARASIASHREFQQN